MKTFQCWLSYPNLMPLCPINSLSDVFWINHCIHSHHPSLPHSLWVFLLCSIFFTFCIIKSIDPLRSQLNHGHEVILSLSQHNSSSPQLYTVYLAHLALEGELNIYFMLLCGFLIFIPQHLIHCLHEEDNEWWTGLNEAYVLLILWHRFLFSGEVFIAHQKSFS